MDSKIKNLHGLSVEVTKSGRQVLCWGGVGTCGLEGRGRGGVKGEIIHYKF